MARPATIDRARRAFADGFGGAPDLVAQAPGRVNLIGEHTDYNDGFVLPMAIDRGTVVAARRGGSDIRVVAADLGDEDRFTFAEPIRAAAASDWRNYLRGVIALLDEEGIAPQGMEIAIAGDVSRGAGLSSSASLEVAVGVAVAALAGAVIDPTRLARIAQRAENEFAGCACGIMDQLVSARAEAGAALLIDCRSLACTPVPVPADVAVLIVESGVRHSNTDGGYNERRASCERAADHFGVAALRDVTSAQVEDGEGLDAVTRRRARHVVTENERTLAAADLLAAGDLRELGRLMAQSHASMRDDFEITVPATDELVALIQAQLDGEGGARQTGGGFGGCVVALLPTARLDSVIAAVRRDYRPPDGQPVRFHLSRPAAGASLVQS